MFKRRFPGDCTINGHNGNGNEIGVLCGEWTSLHGISGNCSAGREAFCVLLERLVTFFHIVALRPFNTP